MAPVRTDSIATEKPPTRRDSRTSQQAILVARVSDSKNAVLELDETGDTLCVWYWPVNDDGGHVVPSDLVAYRNSHQFRGPHCLCAFIDGCDPINHREAAIVISMRGPNAGQYIACCALSKCGYVVCVERMHTSFGLPLKRYPRRAPDEARPYEVMFVDGNDIKLELIQWHQLRQKEETFEKLLKLDSFTQPGITTNEFRGFLTWCNGCDLIMTRRMFERHRCVGKRGDEVIDLTIEGN